MYRQVSVAVVIPAYNEEKYILQTILGIPGLVDEILVVDDGSRDSTAEVAISSRDSRVQVVRHTTNQGVGGAIVTGYREVIRRGLDVCVVMAGDGQMDPADLPALLEPIALGQADYVKGNRFVHPNLLWSMPFVRLTGNFCLSYLTRLSSGYGHIMDSQCGYTAVTRDALMKVDLSKVYRRYGFPNDFLAHLHSAGCRVVQVPVRPVYEGAPSGINPMLATGPLLYVLVRSFAMRMAREFPWTARLR